MSNYYKLTLKNGEEHSRVDRIMADSLEDATLFFMSRKQMDENTFDNLYDVIKEK